MANYDERYGDRRYSGANHREVDHDEDYERRDYGRRYGVSGSEYERRRHQEHGGAYGRRESDYGRGGYAGGRNYTRSHSEAERDRPAQSAYRGYERDEYGRDEMGAQDYRGRGPRGYMRSDDRIREDVNDRLTDDPHIDASDIEVSVSGGEITLNGHVESRAAKRHAEDIAESVSGAKHVQNNLRIKPRIATDSPAAYTGESTGSSNEQWTMSSQDVLKSRQPTGA